MNKYRIVSRLIPAGSFRLRKSFLIIVGFLLLLAGILAYYIPNSIEHDRLATIDIGNEIVKALQAYYDDNSRYPALLDELVPKYLKKIKNPLWGDSGWEYGGSPELLKVGYESHGTLYPLMIYNPEHGWIYDA